MALIKQFVPTQKSNAGVHAPVECGYAFFEADGTGYLQLDTYGSTDRKFPGKVSQSIQLDAEGARALQRVLRRFFPEPMP
jgi:hypothetical protein